MGAKPVILLPLVEHDLESAYSQCEQRKSDVVELDRAFAAKKLRRIFDQPIDKQQRQQPYRQIDQKDPAPGRNIREPAAECWSNRRRTHSRNSIDRKGQAALLRWKSIRQNRLRHGLQASASSALQHAKK